MMIVIVLILLAIAELIPLIVTLAGIQNYGGTAPGRFHQYLNEKVYLGFISWYAFDALAIWAMVSAWRSSVTLGVFVSVAVIIIAYLCVYPLLVPCNTLFTLFARNPPVMRDYVDRFPESSDIEAMYPQIRAEYIRNDMGACVHDVVSGFQISTPNSDKCWRTIVLKRQGNIEESAMARYPVTCSMLKSRRIHNAMFSILDGGVSIPPHYGYYKGYLRYHLGVVCPEQNGARSMLVCGGQQYEWREGQGILFDDMYLHHVVNPTTEQRVVLYLDVTRDDLPAWLDPVRHLADGYIETHPVLKRMIKVQHAQSIN